MGKMRQYLVKWEIDVTAESAQEAAELAHEIQQDPESESTHFLVRTRSTGKEKDIYLD